MPEVEFPAGLLDYFAAREHDWQQRYGFEQFRDQMTMFVDANRERPELGPFLARLVSEASTAAFVAGTRHGAGKSILDIDQPSTSHIFRLMRETTTVCDDIYPAFAVVDGRHPLQNPESAEDEDDD